MKIKFSASMVLIIICVFLFILQNVSEQFFGYDLPLLFGAKINQFILQGQIWRLITPVFLHGSIVHLGFNMYALYSIGPPLERRYGISSFLALFFFGGLFGNIFSFIFSPNISLGSSTAIFGLIAAQAVYIYTNRLLLGSAAGPLLRNVLMMIAVNFVLGLSPGIDNWGHLGGLAGGFAYAWFAGPSFNLLENIYGENVIVRENKQSLRVSIILILVAVLMVALGFQFN